MPFPEKETKENRKKKEKKRIAFFAWRRRSVKVLPSKIMPAGHNFRGQTAQPPDLYGPSETGYLCGLFVSFNGDYKV